MHPILLKFGPLTIYSYGFMVALGFGVATFLIYKRVNKFGLDTDKVIDLAILVLISGVIGARALYVVLNLGYYMSNPAQMLNLSRGGLVWYGGFLAALSALSFYIAKHRINFWDVTDLIVPYLALAQAFGRIGCFLNGCCYGVDMPAAFSFGVIFPGESVMRVPAQLISAAALVLIFIILRFWQEKRHFAGEIFFGYCMLYSLKRYLLEFLRADNPKIAFGLTMSQIISVGIFVITLAVFVYKAIWRKKKITVSK